MDKTKAKFGKILHRLIVITAWLVPAAADAYIGPGAGISAIGSLLTLFAVVLLAIVGFVWYPFKRLMKNRRNTRAGALEKEQAGASNNDDVG